MSSRLISGSVALQTCINIPGKFYLFQLPGKALFPAKHTNFFIDEGLMDLFFVPNRGKPFFIEVGYFDTVLEIKEKVEKYQGIPVARQTLIFNGDVLEDELNVHYSDILDRSRIELLIAPDPNVKNDESLSSSKIHLFLKMPASNVGITVRMNVTESIRGLKEKIQEIEGIPVSRLAIHANGFELHDRRSLQDCGLVDNSELNVLVQASPETTSTGSSVHAVTRPRKLKIVVLTKHGTKRVTLEVNPWEDVGELRPKLQKLEEEMQLDLPKDGYFFIYKQNVMDDDKSFRWHHVGKGDTIEIFSGTVTGGS